MENPDMKYSTQTLLYIGVFLLSSYGQAVSQHPGFEAKVELEEVVYNFVDPNNGTNPMWTFGNTSIVRHGEEVFVSGQETLEGVPLYNNTRWLLYKRDEKGWKLVHKDEKDLTREPSPITVLADGQIFLSVNPTLRPNEEGEFPAEPQLLRFTASEIEAPYKTILPVWQIEDRFRQHSYRSFVADRSTGDLILFQNGLHEAEPASWAYRNAEGDWPSQGKLQFPWGADYEKPQTIRVCYPTVQLKERKVHFFGVSDIWEPNSAWRDYKFDLTGQKWDFEFRRMFYTWSDDITKGQFKPWVEVASREDTCGWLFPADLWVARRGLVHVLWTERAIDERLREKFFPDTRQSHALNYAILDKGKVIFRAPVVQVEEGESEVIPIYGRFHITPDEKIYIFYSLAHKDAKYDEEAIENRIVEVKGNGVFSEPIVLDMDTPIQKFFTATPRSGSAPSQTLDVLGLVGNTMRYARIKVVASNEKTTASEPNLIGAYGSWAAGLANDPPNLSFRNQKWQDVEKWRPIARNRMVELLAQADSGGIPEVTVLEQFEYDGLHVERLSWQLPYGPRTEAIFLKPAGVKGPLPGVLALHDHSGNKYFGKRKVARTADDWHPMMLDHHQRMYEGQPWANALAKRGYAVLIPDIFPFGSRRVMLEDVPFKNREGIFTPNTESEEYIEEYNDWARDHESILAKSLFSAGTTWPAVFLADDQRALDVLCARQDVDANRVGCGGLSGGGMQTVFLGGMDPRIKAAVCVGLMSTWKDYLLNRSNIHTWMAYVPHLPLDLDFPEILGLRVPLPTLVLNNSEDPLFTLPEMKRADRMLGEVYKKAGKPDRYQGSFYPGGHKFDRAMQEEAFAWFDLWLKP